MGISVIKAFVSNLQVVYGLFVYQFYDKNGVGESLFVAKKDKIHVTTKNKCKKLTTLLPIKMKVFNQANCSNDVKHLYSAHVRHGN